MAFERAILGSVRDVAPALSVSRLGFAAMFFQRGVEAFGQSGFGKGLGRKPFGPVLSARRGHAHRKSQAVYQ